MVHLPVACKYSYAYLDYELLYWQYLKFQGVMLILVMQTDAVLRVCSNQKQSKIA